MTEIEKMIHNLRYVIRMLEDENYTREEIVSELRYELDSLTQNKG